MKLRGNDSRTGFVDPIYAELTTKKGLKEVCSIFVPKSL